MTPRYGIWGYDESMSTIYFLLPAYNEEQNLPDLFEAIDAAVTNYRVVLVNDGSKDRTGDIARQYAMRMPITILTHRRNGGLGAALNTGIRYIVAHAEPDAVVVTMDSDLTHDPALVPAMVREIERGYDVVVTSRYVRGGGQHNLALSRRVLSRGINTLLRLKGSKVLDNTSGFRCIRVDALKRALDKYQHSFITTTEFTATVEILVHLQSSGARVKESPIDLDYGKKRGQSKMKVLRTIRTYIRMLTTTGRIGPRPADPTLDARETDDSDLQPRWHLSTANGIRLLVGIALLAVVIWYSRPAELWAVISGVSVLYLVLAGIVHLTATVGNAGKIAVLCDKRDRFGSVFKANLAGMLLADVTPGRSGYFVTPVVVTDIIPDLKRGKVLNAIFFGQMFEFLLRAGLLAAAMLTVFYTLGVSRDLYLYGLLSLALVAALAAAFFVLAFNKVPPSLVRVIDRIGFVSRLYHRYVNYVGSIDYTPRRALGVFLFTLLGWLLTALRWMVVGYALGIDLPLEWYLFLFPALSAVSFIPVSISGLGVVEGGFAVVFLILGGSIEMGVAFALVDRAVALCADLFGLPYAARALGRYGAEVTSAKSLGTTRS
ncbi:MAG: glycosyltransferase [Candidatus Thorarchaeota archaeon]|nr:glycosyltransferase [Candidatus Thorarchaeota archaeon]